MRTEIEVDPFENGAKLLSSLLSWVPSERYAHEDAWQQLRFLWHEDERFRRWVRSLERPEVVRRLRRGKAASSLAELQARDIPGQTIVLFQEPSPTEQQARIATNNVVELWYEFLTHEKHCPPLVMTKQHCVVFVPEGVVFDLVAFWDEFITWLFSTERMIGSLVLLLNSSKLSARGFSVPEVPLVTPDVRDVKCAWLLSVAEHVSQRLRVRQRKINAAQSESERNKLLEKQEKEVSKYREHFERYLRKQYQDFFQLRDKLEKVKEDLESLKKPQGKRWVKLVAKQADMESQLVFSQEWWEDALRRAEEAGFDPFDFLKTERSKWPDLYQATESLIPSFGRTAREQINSARGDILASLLWEAISLIHTPEDRLRLSLPCLFSQQTSGLELRSAGDDHGEFCYACGKSLPKDTAAQEIRRMVFVSPEQRQQSGNSPSRPKSCLSCVAFSFLAGVKPTDDTAIVRIQAKEDAAQPLSTQTLSAQALQRSFARALVNKELHTSAGDYIMLTCAEKVGGKHEPISQKIGAVGYAFFRLAKDLNPQVFQKMKLFFSSSTRDTPFSSAQLLWMHALLEASGTVIVKDRKLNPSLVDALRYTMKGRWFAAEYELAGEVSDDTTFLRTLDMFRFQLRQHLVDEERIMTQQPPLATVSGQPTETAQPAGERTMTQQPSLATQLEHVSAMTALLSAFVDFVNRSVSSEGEGKATREMAKLIEKCDNPLAWSYAFSSQKAINTPSARLYERNDNQFLRQCLHTLCEEMGVDLRGRQEKAQEGESYPYVTIYLEDVVRAYVHLFEKYYKSAYAQKEFVRQLRLSLYSRYPKVISRYSADRSKS